jgi:hypothetical protein
MASIEPEDSTITVDTSSTSPSLQSLATVASQIDQSTLDPDLFNGTFTGSTTASATASATQSAPSLDDLNVPIGSIELWQAQNKRIDLRWTPLMHETLLATMLEQCRDGKRADSGFKKEAWRECKIAVQSVYQGVLTLEDKHMKSKLDWFKLMWKEWSGIDENSGFGWDEPSQLYTAPDDVWKRYLHVSMFLLVYEQNLTL